MIISPQKFDTSKNQLTTGINFISSKEPVMHPKSNNIEFAI